MKSFLIAALALVASANAFASGNDVRAHDIKLPSQAVLEHQTWATPIVATSNQIKTSTGQTNATILTVSSFTHQPDYPRNITVTPGGTTANVGACTVVVSGLDFYGNAITENEAITSTQSTATTGAVAFSKITSVVFPSACAGGTGVTWTIGVGSALGLKRCMANAGGYVFSIFNNVYETTRGTAVATSGTISGNTFAPNGTMNGAKPVELYFVQDYSCHP